MRQPVETQLRNYFEQIEETHGPLSTNAILDRSAGVQVIPESRPMTAPRRPIRRWAWAVALLVFVGVAIVLGILVSDAPPVVDQPVTTTIPATVSTANEPDPIDGQSYEAVFLRLEVVDNSPEVIVVGVNPEGLERQIASFPGAWVAYDIASGESFLAPMGAVSPTGLLAIPSGSFEEMHWEIFDLHRPQDEPIVIAGIQQDLEQLQITPYFTMNMRPSVFWGPDERLAIPWYERGGEIVDWQLSFIEGRTGDATSVDVPDDLVLDRFWTIDGSGVFLRGRSDVGAPHLVLAPDGRVTDGTAAVAESGCDGRYQSGAEVEVSNGQVVLRNPDRTQEALPSPSGVGFACLAPDESAIVFNIEIGDGSGSASASSPLAGLVVPGSDAFVEIEGSFAGWLGEDQ